ncbi:RipA family octameric membrane protein [Kutzneria sp. CA-103260]|uniref:RipA family octameric membrane protein n=1 Tax=Kutzneria sp. CA-103260 TaxID=2802641 RepID=UPI001BA76C6C|nr:hypothetical protein [Kutzneria sp. CA-103260]
MINPCGIASLRALRKVARMRCIEAKWEVVRILETRMPTMANAAGWTHLEADGHRHPYVPTIHIQQAMPVMFGLLYIASLIVVLLTF